MEVRADWTYEEFPECQIVPEGADTLATTGDEIGVSYAHNVVYAHTEVGDLTLQILVPNCRNKQVTMPAPFLADKEGNYPAGMSDKNPQYPCVVYVQGSAWFPQNVYGNIAQLSKLAARGFVVAVVEYRDSLRAHFPAPILDTLNAVRFLRKSGKMYCVDPENIVVAGDSSGGHTALMAGIWCKEDHGDNLYPEISSEVRGIIAYYPACDVSFPDSNPITVNHTKADSPEGMYMGRGDMTEEDIKELTVRTYVTPEAEIPPTLIFHGTKDLVVNTLNSIYLYEKMKECGKDVQLHLLKGANHGGSEFWTEQILDLAEAHIRKVLK